MATSKKKKVEQQITFPDTYHVLSADLSLRRPGFCLLTIGIINGKKTILNFKTISVDNKTTKKTHGEILNDIILGLSGFIPCDPLPIYYVREHAFNSRGAMSEIGIFEVVGITNWMIWNMDKKEWLQLYPVTIKKIITGNAKADKTCVQNELIKYVGEKKWPNDDESDATAVAVAFLIQNKELEDKTQNNLQKS